MALNKGNRVEIAPHYDLWIMGARYGTVVKVLKVSKIAIVKMDHPQVKSNKIFPIDDLTLVSEK